MVDHRHEQVCSNRVFVTLNCLFLVAIFVFCSRLKKSCSFYMLFTGFWWSVNWVLDFVVTEFD